MGSSSGSSALRLASSLMPIAPREDARRVAPANGGEVLRRETDHLERAQLGQPGLDGDVTPPQQAPGADRLERAIEHPAIDAAPRQVEVDVRQCGDAGDRGTRTGPRALVCGGES